MALHGIAWHRMAWHGMAWHRMAWYGMMWHGIAWHALMLGLMLDHMFDQMHLSLMQIDARGGRRPHEKRDEQGHGGELAPTCVAVPCSCSCGCHNPARAWQTKGRGGRIVTQNGTCQR